uniref:Uncharacterized protein n=1 Tax=Arundo donax TaxID=35708 RepID=A0A0A9EHH3_ARUDO
MPNLEHKAAMV